MLYSVLKEQAEEAVLQFCLREIAGSDTYEFPMDPFYKNYFFMSQNSLKVSQSPLFSLP